MKILIISDKVDKSLYDYFDRSRFGHVDMIISCGDLPLYYLNFLIDAFNVPCFYVPGNHDKHFVEEQPQGWVPLDQNIVTYKGITLAGLGGSPFYNGESPFQYSEWQIFWQCFKLNARLLWRKKIDIFVSHSPALGLGDISDSRIHKGFKSIRKFIKYHQPKLFVYGHVHLTYGTQRMGIFNDTLFINSYVKYNVDLLKIEDMKNNVPKKNIYTEA